MPQQQQNKSKGLGDTIEKFTTATGIKKVVDCLLTAFLYSLQTVYLVM